MTERKTYHITTPIYYVNDVPHVGHAYTTIAADTLARALRLQGHDVFLLTGTDEHGQNIERIAREKGISEQEHCDRIVEVWKRLWARLDISHDRFVRTTDDNHVRGVLKLWDRLIEARTPDGREALYRGTYAGWYCPRCEGFKEEEELKQPGGLCPVHERPCEWTEEENFFFRLSAYEGWLRGLIESDEMEIRPQTRKNEVLGIVQQGLKDFSASRARVKWGIPVPQQPDHVMYVWVDALANYVTALGYGDDDPRYRKFWGTADDDHDRVRRHLIGKDIIRFHCLYWPALLHAAGLPVPTHVFAQGWMTKDGRKISKTTGNVIVPDELIDRLGRDAVRYFLLREAPYGQDWDYTDQSFVGRYNSDLADDLGNLVSRALTMVHRYCGGRVPSLPSDAHQLQVALHGVSAYLTPLDFGHWARICRDVLDCYERLEFDRALAQIWALISMQNVGIVRFEPWAQIKDPSNRELVDVFLHVLLEEIRLIATLVSPVIPDAANRIFHMLGLPGGPTVDDYSMAERLAGGEALGPVEPLFPRVEKTDPSAPNSKETIVSEESKTPLAPPVPPSPAAPAGDKIDITDFAKVELRVAQITAAEKVAGSKRLIKLQVDVGTETRQVVAGIAETYEPEALVGKKVALVANLKPAKLMGVESNGMVLAASVDGKAVLCTFDTDVQPGTKIK